MVETPSSENRVAVVTVRKDCVATSTAAWTQDVPVHHVRRTLTALVVATDHRTNLTDPVSAVPSVRCAKHWFCLLPISSPWGGRYTICSIGT